MKKQTKKHNSLYKQIKELKGPDTNYTLDQHRESIFSEINLNNELYWFYVKNIIQKKTICIFLLKRLHKKHKVSSFQIAYLKKLLKHINGLLLIIGNSYKDL